MAAMDLETFMTSKEKLSKGYQSEWLPFCTLEIKTGSLWAGDPYLPNADDGCVVEVPPGTYRVEARGGKVGRSRVVTRLRVYLNGCPDPVCGEEAGDTGTDSAMIGVCDIALFEAAYAQGAADKVDEAIEDQLDVDFGIMSVDGRPELQMPFVPTGSDGSGPVYGLVSNGRVIGIELNFAPED